MKPVFVLVVLSFLSCAKPPIYPAPPSLAITLPPPTEQQRESAEVLARATFAAVGDLMMHGSVKRSAVAGNKRNEAKQSINHEGFDVLFEEISPLISEADYAFANLETPVAPKNNRGVRSMVFNVSTQLLPALDRAGFDMVSFANNHVYDQGRRGFAESLKNLDASDLSYVGAGTTCEAARAPQVTDINGLSVAFIGATLILNDDENGDEDTACVNFLKPEQAIASAVAAKEAGAELVVLSLHWGREYRTKPQRSHVEMAHKLVEGGIDLLIGHHPHVLQPIEVVETKDHRTAVIVYSLGNAISNQSAWYKYNLHQHDQGNPRDGIVLLLDFVRIRYGNGPNGKEQVRTELANLRAVPIWTVNESKQVNGRSTPYIRVVPTHVLLHRAEQQLEFAKSAEEAVQLKRKIALYTTRLKQVARVLGPGFLSEP